MNENTEIEFAGPSQKMRDALENEGLRITWPKQINYVEDLAIEATYYTGCDWEKCVLIDLRDEGDLSTEQNVDAAIANQLDEAYEAYDVGEEMKWKLGGNGAPDAERLLEDLQEADGRLKRFAAVANAVMNGKPIPAKEDDAEITVRGKDAKRVCDLLEKIAYFHASGPWNNEERAFAKMIGDEMRNKIKANM